MAKAAHEKHEVTLVFCRDTEKGVQVHNGIKNAEGKFARQWLPKSQITTEVPYLDMETNKAYTFSVPQWLLEDKGLELDV